MAWALATQRILQLMKNILITGGSGLVGRHLKKLLTDNGFSVAIVSRSPTNASQHIYHWDIHKNYIDDAAVVWADAIVHLAGAGIADRLWTAARKKEIAKSRIQSANIIYSACERLKKWPACFISSSAVGYYGDTGDTMVNEDSAAGTDFLGTTCVQWEAEAKKFADHGVRVAMMRTGIVLAREGGALPLMSLPIKFYVGSPLGDGLQYISWIHIDDLCQMYLAVLQNIEMEGPYNAVASMPVTNETFTQAMATILQKPLWFPAIPAWLLKLLLGELSETVLMSSRVSNDKIKATGYAFRHDDLLPALRGLLK